MSRRSPGFRHEGGASQPPRVLPVMCFNCGTDRRLTISSVTHLRAHPADVVLVSYTCSRCGLFNEHLAGLADVSMVLASADQPAEVMIFGGHYMHCGQPMKKAGSEVRRLSAPLSTEDTDEDELSVYLSTRVLRCACGFQMELPE